MVVISGMMRMFYLLARKRNATIFAMGPDVPTSTEIMMTGKEIMTGTETMTGTAKDALGKFLLHFPLSKR